MWCLFPACDWVPSLTTVGHRDLGPSLFHFVFFHGIRWLFRSIDRNIDRLSIHPIAARCIIVISFVQNCIYRRRLIRVKLEMSWITFRRSCTGMVILDWLLTWTCYRSWNGVAWWYELNIFSRCQCQHFPFAGLLMFKLVLAFMIV